VEGRSLGREHDPYGRSRRSCVYGSADEARVAGGGSRGPRQHLRRLARRENLSAARRSGVPTGRAGAPFPLRRHADLDKPVTMDFPGKQVTTASRARRWCERGGNQHSCQQGRHLQPASWIARTRRIDIEIDIFDAALRLGVSVAAAPRPIAQMHVSDFLKK
jgi:hypothetical protein